MQSFLGPDSVSRVRSSFSELCARPCAAVDPKWRLTQMSGGASATERRGEAARAGENEARHNSARDTFSSLLVDFRCSAAVRASQTLATARKVNDDRRPRRLRSTSQRRRRGPPIYILTHRSIELRRDFQTCFNHIKPAVCTAIMRNAIKRMEAEKMDEGSRKKKVKKNGRE